MQTDSASKGKNERGVTNGIIQDPGRRFPLLTTPEAFESLSYLSEKDKRIARELHDQMKMTRIEGVEQPPDHAAIQARNPYMILQSDPELFAADLRYAEDISVLVYGMNNKEVMAATDPSKLPADPNIRRRYNVAHLIITKVAYEYRDEWTLQLMATMPGLAHISKQQFALLDQPQSVVWDEEQRLILEYAASVIHRKMTDELLARAEAMWGRKQTLRYTAMITRYVAELMFNYVNVSDAERLGLSQGGTCVNHQP